MSAAIAPTGPDFYPASGHRATNSGGLSNVGTYGYSWSNSPLSATSMTGSTLDFGSGLVSPESNSNRAGGFPVRCVQE